MTANTDPLNWRKRNPLADDFPILGNLLLAALQAEEAYLAANVVHTAAVDCLLTTDRRADAATRATYERARKSLEAAVSVELSAEFAFEAAFATYKNVVVALGTQESSLPPLDWDF
jgi:hypothetical protein